MKPKSRIYKLHKSQNCQKITDISLSIHISLFLFSISYRGQHMLNSQNYLKEGAMKEDAAL